MNEEQEIVSVEEADFDYNDLPVEEETQENSEEAVSETEETTEPENVQPQPQEPVEEKPADDFEEAARIAKAKQREKGLDLKEKQEFTSKFEALADASSSHAVSEKQTKNYRKKDKDEEKRRPTFDLTNKEYEFKPIYTEEELAEIERQEEEERENDWINDDIDFDEYDKYYD